MDNYFGNNNRRLSWVQYLFLLCIISLAACIFPVLANDNTALIASSHTIGIPLFIAGVVSIIIAAIKKSTLKGRMWLLFDGAVTTVLSVLLMLNSIDTIESLPFYFALWEIALGVFKIIESHNLKREEINSHEGFLYIGIAEIISGVGFLIRPIDRIVGYNIAVVITVAIQMGAYALRYYLYPAMTEE